MSSVMSDQKYIDIRISESLKKSVPERFSQKLGARIMEIAEILKKKPKGKKRVFHFNRIIDSTVKMDIASLKEIDGREPSCRKGCNHCCHQHVDLFDEEAKVLADMIRGGAWYNKSELERTKDWKHKDYLASDGRNPCIFLKDGECAIYHWRPVVCRKYFVVTPPEDCSTIDNKGGQVASPSMIDSEIAFSAMGVLQEHRDHASMPHMINLALKDKL